MAFLQNYKRVYQIGRSFGTNDGGRRHAAALIFGGFGKVLQPRAHGGIYFNMLDRSNPYIVKRDDSFVTVGGVRWEAVTARTRRGADSDYRKANGSSLQDIVYYLIFIRNM
jgi:hypothetical protein